MDQVMDLKALFQTLGRKKKEIKKSVTNPIIFQDYHSALHYVIQPLQQIKNYHPQADIKGNCVPKCV